MENGLIDCWRKYEKKTL